MDVRVRLLGELDVRVADGRAVPPLPARAASLLAYLVLHAGARHPRQRLAFLLWPDSTESQARTNLRNVLHLLRRALPEAERFLEVTPATLSWTAGAGCWVDVAAFADAVAAGARAAAAGDEQARAAALRAAVDLYAGDLLEGCYDEWLAGERERIRDSYLAVLRELTRSLVSAGHHAEAVRAGRQLVREEPLSEEHHRLLIAAHEAAGDRAGAVRAYHECAAVLEQELSVAPSPATREALARVMGADGVAGAPVGGSPVASRPPGHGLVGRRPELERLAGRWREAEEGRAHMVLVTGEAGVGKTRLVDELASWCDHRGALVARARSYATEGELGRGLVISWLRSPGVAAHLRRAPEADRAELGRLVPELAPGGAKVAPGGGEGDQRLRLLEAVARGLSASGRPLLLVADDAHWADGPSLQAVHYLVRSRSSGPRSSGPRSSGSRSSGSRSSGPPPHLPVLIVATARTDELDERHPLAALVAALHQLDRVEEVSLGRLGPSETLELARELAGPGFGEARAGALHDETEGNPLFVVEAIRAGWDGTAGRPPLTPKLHAVVTARLRRLSEPAGHLLGVAATVGRAFTAELVGQAAGMDDLELVRALDELWRRHLIREHDADAYDFSHGKIRDVAYDGLSPATRRRNHLRVAEALVALHPADPGVVSGQVAANYDRAGRSADAVAWYVRAAAQAMRLSAEAEAVRVLERAGALLPSLPEAARAGCEREILAVLPTAVAGVEGYTSDRLAEAQQRALRLAAAAGAEPDPPLLRSLVMSSLCRDEFGAAREAAERLRASAERSGDEGLAVESGYLLGIAAFWGADLASARQRFEEVVARFRPDQRAEHLIRFGQDPQVVCLSRLGNTRWFLGDPGGARQASDAALARAGEVGHSYTALVAHVFAALLAVDLDDHDRLARVVEQAEALAAARLPSRPFEIKFAALQGLVQVLGGQEAEGVARIRQAIQDCGPRNPVPSFRAALARVLLAAVAVVGDPAAGLAATDEALTLGGTRLWEPEAFRLRAEFRRELGHPPALVDADLARAAEVAAEQGALGHQRRITSTRARILAAG
jgi:DNA-binding SARP family transcriptional activator